MSAASNAFAAVLSFLIFDEQTLGSAPQGPLLLLKQPAEERARVPHAKRGVSYFRKAEHMGGIMKPQAWRNAWNSSSAVQ